MKSTDEKLERGIKRKGRRRRKIECMGIEMVMFTNGERGRGRAAGEGPEGARGRSAPEFERAEKVPIELNDF